MDDPRKLVLERLKLGKQKYGHGVRVDMDTVTWGTKKNAWLEMAREEFLDAVVYVIADYIAQGRKSEKLMSVMEMNYYLKDEFLHSKNPRKWIEEHREPDDNGLIMFAWDNIEKLDEGFHKQTLMRLSHMIHACL